jgi:hypothetical protein
MKRGRKPGTGGTACGRITKAQVVALHEAGQRHVTIAALASVTKERIRAVVRDAGLPSRWTMIRVRNAERAAAEALRVAALPPREEVLAARLQARIQRVRDRLQPAVALWAAGLQAVDIALQLNLSLPTLRGGIAFLRRHDPTAFPFRNVRNPGHERARL